MLYYYASETELAYYALANKVFEIFGYSIIVIVEILLPWMCKMVLAEDKNPRIIIWYKCITFICMILAVMLALYLPGLFTIFWGDKFAKANNLILLLMCGACISPVYCLMYYLFVSVGKERYLLITVSFSTLIQVFANFILIPRYGSFGATIGMIILICSSFIMLSIYFVKGRMNAFMPISRILMIYGVIILSLYLFIKNIQLTYVNNIIFLICLISAGAFSLMTKSERFLFITDIKATLRTLNNKIGGIQR